MSAQPGKNQHRLMRPKQKQKLDKINKIISFVLKKRFNIIASLVS